MITGVINSLLSRNPKALLSPKWDNLIAPEIEKTPPIPYK